MNYPKTPKLLNHEIRFQIRHKIGFRVIFSTPNFQKRFQNIL